MYEIQRRHFGNGILIWLVPAGVLGMAVCAGMATAVVGAQAGYKSVYYAAVFGLLGAAVLVAMTRDEPMRLLYFALLLCLPMANVLVPPGRFGLTVFNTVTIAAALVLIGKRILADKPSREPLFPGHSMTAAWLLSLPCVAFSLFPLYSLRTMLVNAGIYAFFLMTLRELQRNRGFERIVSMLAIAMLVIDAGLFVDHFLHVNLSLRGTNENQFTMAGGMQIWRAGGFFQDPQIAGAFLACSITFVLILLIRGRFRGMRLRYLATLAVAASLAALLTTISRGAIISCIVVSAVALFVFNRWSGPMKLVSAGALLALAVILFSIPFDSLMRAAPPAVAERFEELGESLDTRLMIWFDTWDMFAEHPLTGIGMNSFRPYLLETRPGVVNYYGIGLGTGSVYVPNQPENGYLKILYEGGLLGSLAVLVIAGDLLRRALAVIFRSDSESQARTEGIAAMAGLTAFAITFVTRYTLSDARMAALFTMLIAAVWWRSLERSRRDAGAAT